MPALALTAAVLPAASAAAATRVALPSPNLPSLASLLTEGATTKPLDPTMQLSLRVYLGQQPGLAAAAAAVSNPDSADYAHYLTVAQYQRLFGPTAAQTAAVSGWLTSLGITIASTTTHYLAVTATVAQADAAFDTQFSEYDMTYTVTGKGGGTYTESTPGVVGGFSVPAALSGDVVSVTGLNQVVLPDSDATSDAAKSPATTTAETTRTGETAEPSVKRTAAKTAAEASTASTYQCSQYWDQYSAPIPTAYGQTSAPTALCGYTPNQIRQAYGLTSSPYTGKGATIAIISTNDKPTMLADANEYFADNGEAGFAAGQYSDVALPDEAASCAGIDPQPDPEEAIDVESAHIAAPDAKVVNVATDCDQQGNDEFFLQTSLDGASLVVDQHLADIVNGSFGIAESVLAPADLAAWEPLLQQGALEGIGFDFSSGDGGDAYGYPQTYSVNDPQFPAIDPWATAVGGTSLSIGQNGNVVGDYAWGDNYATLDADGTGYDPAPPGTFEEGSGGGVSTIYAEPGYQKAAVPSALATNGGTTAAARVMPDISADAGNNWLIGYTGIESDDVYNELPVGGGTSASSPFMAGLEADAMQAVGHPLGFANPVIYCLDGSSAIRDILPVNPADPPIVDGAQQGYDIDQTQVLTLGEDATLATTPGYDDATGLGAPTTSFVADLAAAARG